MTPNQLKRMRLEMGLSQQAFAALLGFSFVSINKWENGGSPPAGLHEVVLVLLKNALRRHGAAVVTGKLREAGGVHLELVRTLAALERS